MSKLNTRIPALATLLVTRAAFAQSYSGGLGAFTSLASSLLTFVQALGLLGAVGAFIRVGWLFYEGDERATKGLKNAAVGTAVVAGGVIIVQFIKNALASGSSISL